jgi:hypothetical protein
MQIFNSKYIHLERDSHVKYEFHTLGLHLDIRWIPKISSLIFAEESILWQIRITLSNISNVFFYLLITWANVSIGSHSGFAT